MPKPLKHPRGQECLDCGAILPRGEANWQAHLRSAHAAPPATVRAAEHAARLVLSLILKHGAPQGEAAEHFAAYRQALANVEAFERLLSDEEIDLLNRHPRVAIPSRRPEEVRA